MNTNNSAQKISLNFIVKILKVLFPFVLIFILLNIFIEIHYTKKDIKNELKIEYSSFSEPLKHAMWKLDHNTVKTICNGALLLNSISGIKIEDSNGKVVVEKYETYQNNFFIEEIITYEAFNKKITLGTIILYSNSSTIYNRLKVGWVMIVLSTILLSLISISLIIATFNKLVNKPLFQFINEIEDINFNKKTNPIMISNDDSFEITQLKNSFNNMITKLNLSQNELLDLNYTLESKVKERTLELENKNTQLDKATKAKSEFLANMSHEIRTPMNGIIGMTHLALQSNPDHKQQKFLNTINNSANSLLNIINDILDFSKIEAGKLTIDKIDFRLDSLLEEVSNLVKFKADEKGLDFDIEYQKNIYLEVYADRLRILQILINLLNNGIKFTNSGYVKLTISKLNQDDKFRFTVSDSGIGITVEQQQNLFNSFSQADGSITRNYGGTGLGLSISKQLVELMGGKIWVESEIEKGSEFIFELSLPKAKKKIETQQNKQIDISILKNSQILLVEDNQTNQEIIIGLLENSGINIDIAFNGKEAVDKFTSNKDKYELILMDLQMPIMDGYEATKQIKAISKDIPIIALTANAMKEDIEKTKLAGMSEHLNKPIDVEKLYATLLKYISRKVSSEKLVVSSDSSVKCSVLSAKFDTIDTNIGLSHMGGNEKLYLKILNDFVSNYENLNLEILNDEEFTRTIHTLKGLSANIGANTVNQIALEIEHTKDKTLLPKLYEELNKVISELKEKLNTTNSKANTKKPLDPSKRDELFNSLKEAVESKRIQKCRPIIEEIEQYQLNSEDKELFDIIKNYIEEFDFRSANKILENNSIL